MEVNEMDDKYGNTPIQRNWNRMAELSRKVRSAHPRSRLDAAEFSYRITVQNFFANEGTMPDDYIPVGMQSSEATEQ